MAYRLFLIVGITHLIALISPGPDAAMVIRNSTRLPPSQALWGVLGLSCGILAHTFLALTGVSLLIQQVPWIKGLIQIGGGSYLLWMAWQSLREARSHKALSDTEHPSTITRESVLTTWLQGMATNLLNPKALMYFVSILTSVITPDSSTLFKAALGIEIFAISLA